MEPTETVPTFILFAWQGCNAPGLLADPWNAQPVLQDVRPVTIPLILLLSAATAMLLGLILWWREVPKGMPMALIAIGLLGTFGFLGFQAHDVYFHTPSFDTFLNGGNYYVAIGEFSFYLLFVTIMILVSFILIWREVGWEAERNLLFLATGGTVGLTLCWLFFSIAVWNCV